MAFECRATTINDEPALIELLTRVFDTDRQAPFVNPALLRWKYWEPREDYPQPRSYVLEKGGRIVAHIGLWPVTLRTQTKSETGVHIIDWAADPEASGSGVFLLQRMARMFDFVYAVGGSDATQAILPKFGFLRTAEAQLWARPIRPWRQIRHRQHNDLLLPLRLARNTWWSQMPRKAVAPAWALEEMDDVSSNGLRHLAPERPPSFFQYIRHCPTAQSRVYRVLHNGHAVGFFVLGVIWEQARVAGVWLEDSSPETWNSVFHLAQDVALKSTEASELSVRCGSEHSIVGAQQAGLRLRVRIPVFVFRKDGVNEPLQLPFHFFDDDAFFLGGRSFGFLT